MAKSVVIIGKGPSVLKSTKEFVDSFDEVAICNFPPMEGYEKYIGSRATYHFLNAHDPNPYKKDILNSLGLKYMFNTHYAEHEGYQEIFPEHDVMYLKDYGQKIVPEFKKVYGLDPSTGIQAFDYFVKKEEYETIGLVGFDFFKVGEKGYYYPPNEVQQSLRYLYTNDGTRAFNSKGYRVNENPHDSLKSEKFVFEMINRYGKELIFPNEN